MWLEVVCFILLVLSCLCAKVFSSDLMLGEELVFWGVFLGFSWIGFSLGGSPWFLFGGVLLGFLDWILLTSILLSFFV